MLHERLNRVDNISMLLIRRKVQNHICLWDEIFVGTYRESVLSRAKVRSALLSNRCFAERVGDIHDRCRGGSNLGSGPVHRNRR